jgi:p-cumate 2,3-dioxygenase beta subunit
VITEPAGAPATFATPPAELVNAVSQFLYAEADLLDEWRLDEWLELMTDDVRYTVPSTDLATGNPSTDLVLIDDDINRLRARVKRLNSRRAHREFPTSRTRRLITNVRVVDDDGTQLDVTANYVVYRVRQGVNAYMGKYRYRLVRHGDGFRIRSRRAELDLETLTPHGTVSIIL